MLTSAHNVAIVVLLQSDPTAPLPAESPIGGPLWSYVVPAALLGVTILGTVMLYRHFAKLESRGEDDER